MPFRLTGAVPPGGTKLPVNVPFDVFTFRLSLSAPPGSGAMVLAALNVMIFVPYSFDPPSWAINSPFPSTFRNSSTRCPLTGGL